MKTAQRSVGVLTFPMSRRGDVVLLKLGALLSPLSGDIYVITGREGRVPSGNSGARIHTYRIGHEKRTGILSRILNYIWVQLLISCRVARLTRKVDLWIFQTGGEGLLLPMLTVKLLGKRVALALAGFGINKIQAIREPLSIIMDFLARTNCSLANRIIVYSEKLIEEGGLEKYRDKISIAYEYFLDLDMFKLQKPLTERGNLVGFVGGLSKEKGILNFLEAIPRVLEEKQNIEFLIGGDGALRSDVEDYLPASSLQDKVKFVGWIPHEELPQYLNELKLLVLPSYTEGLPGMVLEAMACGTPVLATPVGLIPEVIKDGETGFIMEDNSPENIARNVIRSLKHPGLADIVKDARTLIEQRYTYEALLDKWRDALSELTDIKK